jgi:hypothetical protein
MPAALHDAAMINDDDQVRIADCRKPVCDDDAGAAFHRKIKCSLHGNF